MKKPLFAGDGFWDTLKKMVADYTRPSELIETGIDLPYDSRAPIKFITHAPYSTYVVVSYNTDPYDPASYDLDGDYRGDQKYVILVDGEEPIPVSIMKWDKDGNHKQMISFVGDTTFGTLKLVLDGNSTTEIELKESVLTETYLIGKLEGLPSVGKGNLKVTIWPGRWLIEFAGKLAGKTFDPFEADIEDTASFDVFIYPTNWDDSGLDDEVIYPIPMVGAWDNDAVGDNINDAVAAGSFGTAQHFPGIGLVVDVNECRDYLGDGTPEL